MYESSSDAARSASESELFGHLIPLHENFLIVPKIAVLEVLGMEQIGVQTAGPAWWVGNGEWRGRELPIVSLEAMAGNSLPTRSRRTRAVVINGYGEYLTDGLFMLLAQGYPHLTALNAEALRVQPRQSEDEGIALSRVRLASTQAIIPDLDAIEEKIAAAVAQVGDQSEAGEDWDLSSFDAD